MDKKYIYSVSLHIKPDYREPNALYVNQDLRIHANTPKEAREIARAQLGERGDMYSYTAENITSRNYF